jgi:hypothetical protein
LAMSTRTKKEADVMESVINCSDETRATKDDMIRAGVFDKNERSRNLESVNCQVLSIICITSAFK